MGEVAYMDEGDLEAVVKGYSCSGESSGGLSPSFCLPADTASLYEHEMETTGLDELGVLYKPFYPSSTQTLTNSVSVPKDSRDDKKTHGCLLANGSRADQIRILESKVKRSVIIEVTEVIEHAKNNDNSEVSYKKTDFEMSLLTILSKNIYIHSYQNYFIFNLVSFSKVTHEYSWLN